MLVRKWTNLCLASRKKTLTNSVGPDETPHDAASHQGLRCLLKGISVRNILNIEINILDIPYFGNKLIQFRRMGESTRHKWVKRFAYAVRTVLSGMTLSPRLAFRLHETLKGKIHKSRKCRPWSACADCTG